MLRSMWQSFLLLGWIGKSVTVIGLLYSTGWLVGRTGWDSAARGFGSLALNLLGLLLTTLVIRGVWRAATARHRT